MIDPSWKEGLWRAVFAQLGATWTDADISAAINASLTDLALAPTDPAQQFITHDAPSLAGAGALAATAALCLASRAALGGSGSLTVDHFAQK
jgi:hypothetical protein